MARKVALRKTPSARLNFTLSFDYLGCFFILLLAHQKAHADFCVVCACRSAQADERLGYVRLCGREAVYARTPAGPRWYWGRLMEQDCAVTVEEMPQEPLL